MRKLALLAVMSTALLGAQSQQAVNIQLIAYIRPNTVVGTVTFYDSGTAIASAPAHGGLVRIIVPLTPGVHQLQAITIGSGIYGSSASEIESYTVDPSQPLVMFGM